MRAFIFVLSFFMLSISTANAYIDDTDLSAAQTRPGDQNTNLYQLHNKGLLAVKKLKKVDELVVREEAAGRSMHIEDIDTFLNDAENVQTKQFLKKVFKDVSEKSRNPRVLKTNNTGSVLEEIASVVEGNVRDKDIVGRLKNQLSRSGL